MIFCKKNKFSTNSYGTAHGPEKCLYWVLQKNSEYWRNSLENGIVTILMGAQCNKYYKFINNDTYR